MALTVNGDPHPWHEGLTVALLLKEKTFTFPLTVIHVNQRLVKRADYAKTLLADGDRVEVVHLVSGG
jgi:sulfur carrier protein